jgi:hypothetical protein
MTILGTVKANNDLLERSRAANEFLQLAGFLVKAHRGNILDARRLAVEANAPPRVQEFFKAAVTTGSTTSLASLVNPQIAQGFMESLRPISPWDFLRANGMGTAPLYSNNTTLVSSAMTANTVAEGSATPVTSLTLDQGLTSPQKVVAIVAGTDELFRFSKPAAETLFAAELRRAVSVATNKNFLAGLVAGTTPIGSSGSTTANCLTDLAAVLAPIVIHAASKLFFIYSGDDAKGLAFKVNSAGALQFPNALASGSQILPGVVGLISDDLPSGTAIMLDASSILAGEGDTNLDTSREAAPQMNSSPDSPPTSSTVPRLLWQNNETGIRCSRVFGYKVARAAQVQSLSGVNY